jgi:Ser-tRNA(Ala) deacylase AlaX
MATQLLYLEDFDVCACSATVTGVATTEDGRVDITLDQTCFYPRGGGQDWDYGMITGNDGSAELTVNEVRLDETGIVHHYGTYAKGALKAGDSVNCTVDVDRRSTNTRLHSAGHVIDMAVDALGYADWVPTKGQHYPELSAVEYAGTLDPAKWEEVRAALEAKANEFINAGSKNTVRFMPVEEMHSVCRHVPTNIPTNKPARVVMYSETFGIPCGGTHVEDIKDIGKIGVPKVKEKKGVIRVNYTVEGIN